MSYVNFKLIKGQFVELIVSFVPIINSLLSQKIKINSILNILTRKRPFFKLNNICNFFYVFNPFLISNFWTIPRVLHIFPIEQSIHFDFHIFHTNKTLTTGPVVQIAGGQRLRRTGPGRLPTKRVEDGGRGGQAVRPRVRDHRGRQETGEWAARDGQSEADGDAGTIPGGAGNGAPGPAAGRHVDFVGGSGVPFRVERRVWRRTPNGMDGAKNGARGDGRTGGRAGFRRG